MPAEEEAASGSDPDIDREIRGLFVATVFNTDWPSHPGLDPQLAKDEIQAIVERAAELNCNVIYLQVRSLGDRIYSITGPLAPAGPDPPNSGCEMPWSIYVQPAQLSPDYDPLREWINAAHAKGIELHAWINPLRIDKPIKNFPIYDGQDGFLYMDYRYTEVQDYVVKVIDDLLKNYGPPVFTVMSGGANPQPAATEPGGDDNGLDGIILDHYYPPPPGVPDPGETGTQPPGPSPAASPMPLSKRRQFILDQWTMNHGPLPTLPSPAKEMVDLITTVSDHAHANTVHGPVRVGISPSKGQQAKVASWLPKVDYVAPEIYNSISDDPDDPDDVAPWFESQLTIWIGQAASANPSPVVVPVVYTSIVQSRKGKPPWSRDEIVNQIGKLDAKNLGHIHYSYHAIRSPAQGGPKEANNIGEKLKTTRYVNPAVPDGNTTPHPTKKPTTQPAGGGAISVDLPNTNVWYWVLRRQRTSDNKWEQVVHKADKIVFDATEVDPAAYKKFKLWALDNHARKSQPLVWNP